MSAGAGVLCEGQFPGRAWGRHLDSLRSPLWLTEKGREGMHPDTLRGMAYVLANASADDLMDAGVLVRRDDGKPAVGGSDWTRFNNDLLTFIIKLPDDRLAALGEFLRQRIKHAV